MGEYGARVLDAAQQIQEEQYGFPYHYLPDLGPSGEFSHAQYWSWGYRYLGGFEVVLNELETRGFSSLVDIGCGDGRFLTEAAKRFKGHRLLGVDYSARAIALAKAMNPGLDFQQMDIGDRSLDPAFEAATMIEVLEHIPPEEIPEFIAGIRASLVDDATLVLTVPHRNQRVSDKHYQHFDSDLLVDVLNPHFRVDTFIPFDTRSRVFAALRRVFAGKGDHFVITDKRLLGWFFRLYRNRYLYAADESHCSRIAAVCTAR